MRRPLPPSSVVRCDHPGCDWEVFTRSDGPHLCGRHIWQIVCRLDREEEERRSITASLDREEAYFRDRQDDPR